MTPLRQALSEALTSNVLHEMWLALAAGEQQRADGVDCLCEKCERGRQSARDIVLAALDAIGTTARETPTNRPPADAKEWTCDECGNDLLWCKHGRKAAALPSSPPAAPPATECVNWDECSHGVVPCREFGCLKVSTPAQRRAETPTPCRVCGFKWGMGFVCELPPGHSCDHEAVYNDTPLGRDYVYAPNVPSPAPPEGPRDVAPATCQWTEDSGGLWTTDCGNAYSFVWDVFS